MKKYIVISLKTLLIFNFYWWIYYILQHNPSTWFSW